MSDELTESGVSARFPDLADKAAIVTGASRGIGCGIASFLGRQGVKLTLTARTEDRGQAFARQLTDRGVDCQWVTADCSEPAEAQRVFDAAIERYDRVDLLVNNAAWLKTVGILELTEEMYQGTFERNVRLVYQLSHLVSRHMVDTGGGGSIVNISSVGGLRAHHHAAGYDGSKGAMDAMTRSMAVDLAAHGIRVNSVAPGATDSRGEAFWASKPRRAEHRRRKEALIPLGRYGTPEDMGAAVAFLASDAAAYITGQILYVDGGITTQLSPPGVNL